MHAERVLELGGDAQELQRIATTVEQLAGEQGWPADLSYQVVLVLEELQMNIRMHAYPQGTEPHSRIALRCEPGRLTIEISDQGRPFNPLEETPAPDLDATLDEREVGGLGVHLVKNLMDDISYRREDGSNHLTLVKELAQ